MSLYVINLYCFAFSILLLGFMIRLKLRDRVGKAWFHYSIVCCLWAVGYSFQINNVIYYDKALWASRYADAVAIFIPFTWLRFIYAFLDKKESKRLFRFLFLLSAAILLTTPTPLFIPSLKDKAQIGFAHFVDAGPSFDVFSIMYGAVVIYGFCLIIKAYYDNKKSLEKRNQIKWLIIANGVGFLSGSTAFLPVYDIDIPIGYFSFGLPVFPFLMALAITRYRLLDIDEIAKAAHREKLAAIGTLATSLNHEIRNPLYIIQGLADSHLTQINESGYPAAQEVEKSRQILTKTREQATRAMDIMKHFAVFAKQQANENAAIESVNLNETLNGILPLVGRELELEKIEIQQNIPENLPTIKADRRHLEQILFNLIVNACQAMKNEPRAASHEPRITISASQQNGHVNILIRDTGPGIPADRLKQIFDPFYTTKEEGTGLGLYITKQLVERNGGRITVKSQLEKGTEFSLEFNK